MLQAVLRHQPPAGRSFTCWLSTSTTMQALCLIILATIGVAKGGYAPKESPKLPDGFCPKETGTATATTGVAKTASALRSHNMRG
ncbi:hypothetical protein QTG54_014701 [Skeletonema marinoi]|uniref:Uncharacterized protein n=1 Tax=Skeletonema marinoi TaxID=267567 RepID=A0AAD8XW93_9STRA|nr:hypothetical protein QTG54_014701 [Skeletonema marinoi]